MPGFRIDTLADAGSGMIFAEVRSEAGDRVIVRSEPMYRTHEEAEHEIATVLKRAWPSGSPFAEDPTIGV